MNKSAMMRRRSIAVVMAAVLCLSGMLSACAVSAENAGDRGSSRDISDRASGSTDDSTSGNPRTDTEALTEWFPAFKDMDGITGALWEAEVLGGENGRASLPGPNDYHIRGFLFVDKEVVDGWMRTYSFEEVPTDLTSAYWDASAYEDVTWYRSWDFEDAYLPGYYHGYFYVSDYGIFFDVTTT